MVFCSHPKNSHVGAVYPKKEVSMQLPMEMKRIIADHIILHLKSTGQVASFDWEMPFLDAHVISKLLPNDPYMLDDLSLVLRTKTAVRKINAQLSLKEIIADGRAMAELHAASLLAQDIPITDAKIHEVLSFWIFSQDKSEGLPVKHKGIVVNRDVFFVFAHRAQ